MNEIEAVGEETGGCEIGGLTYIASEKVDDWRYRREESGIMTTLFLGKLIFGHVKPTDDIEELKWVSPTNINVEKDIMPEHQNLFKILMTKTLLSPNNLMKQL